jgi:hypothetical protein
VTVSPGLGGQMEVGGWPLLGFIPLTLPPYLPSSFSYKNQLKGSDNEPALLSI